MALPTLVKTWQYNVNQTIAAAGTDLAQAQNLMYAIKNSLVTFASNPWTVSRSSDGSSAGTSDKWVNAGNLIWNTTSSSARSWIVLKQTALNLELLIDLMDTSGRDQITILVSPTASFTGGTTTARPTATDERVASWFPTTSPIGTNNNWGHLGSVGIYRLHVWQSSDGECTRFMIWRGGLCYGFALFDKLANAPAEWVNPVVWGWNGSNASNVLTFANYTITNSAQSAWFTGEANGIRARGTMGGECVNAGNTILAGNQTFVNEISSEWPMFPIDFDVTFTGYSSAIADYATVGANGRQGTFVDLWMGSSGVSTSDTYPNDASNQFAQFTQLIFPWNGGTAPATT